LKTASLLLSTLLLLIPAISHAQTEPGDTGFLCCNMRGDGRWISDANYAEAGNTILPLGTPVRVIDLARYRVNVEINGKRQAIGNDYSRDLSITAFAKRYIVKDDPQLKLAAMPDKIRTAVESARVTPGMSREQVLMAMGYPISSENPHLDARRWKYWLWSFSPFTVVFNAEGRVSKVEADGDLLDRVYFD